MKAVLVAGLVALATASATGAQVTREDNRTAAGVVLKDDLDARLAAFVALAQGEYRGRWPGAFAKKPQVPEIEAWAVFKRVEAPQFSPVTLYQEVREGGPDGRIVRQRIIAFDTAPDRTHNLATFYPIMDPAAAPRADLHPERLAALSPANLPYFGRGCQMNVIGGQPTGFRILTAPTSCVIPYPDGRSRYTGMEMTFDGAGFTFQEAAYGVDGAFWAGRLETSRFTRTR
ncbi:CpcT/CpeT family chromophore lyase [Novosphingobium sp. BL-52-GroH]|uniref:CpcT/CpeT family chromophore lyase n=1 Tax=Novosphingobium sp. BL-52-GroH TaxID=3349877 RepID=UPI0038506A26